jgi:predicted DsbA family dithiol-disulfide isomerase
LKREQGVKVVLTHFPLHPETPPEGRTLEDLFRGRNFDPKASHARLSALMAEEGLPYAAVRTHTYNSRLAQELGKWADTQPGGEAVHNALFRAYFVDTVNIGRIEELVRIAGEAGLDKAEARRVLETRSFQAAVDGDWKRAHAFGISGVPTFVAGQYGLVGAQPHEMLVKLVEKAGEEAAAG